MQVIHHANEDILCIWGENKIMPSTYRLLIYLIPVEVEGGTLLHNVVSGELIFLDDIETQRLSSLPCEYAPWMDALIRKHFLVQTESDDKKTVDTLRSVWKVFDKRKEITNYTILPTTDCNARCFYCFEAGIKHETMSDATADKIPAFVAAHCGDKPIYIRWFGGEPTLGAKQIHRICNGLREQGISFVSGMISNGYLFSKTMAREAKDVWNLHFIQITLDGTEEVYNRTKAYVYAKDSPFQRVLNNIQYLLDMGIHVRVLVNLGMHNLDDLTMLIENLKTRFESNPYLTVMIHRLFDNFGFEPIHSTVEDKAYIENCAVQLEKQLYAVNMLEIEGSLPILQLHRCMADSPDSLVITPTGAIGKCEHYMSDLLIGDLDKGITDKRPISQFCEKEPMQQCSSCALYPNCIRLKPCFFRVEDQCPKTDVSVKLQAARYSILDYYRNHK